MNDGRFMLSYAAQAVYVLCIGGIGLLNGIERLGEGSLLMVKAAILLSLRREKRPDVLRRR